MAKFTSMVVVFTGFRDDTLKYRIESEGGEVKASITKKTTLVIYKGKDSAKYKDAAAKGLTLMTQAEFEKKYFIFWR